MRRYRRRGLGRAARVRLFFLLLFLAAAVLFVEARLGPAVESITQNEARIRAVQLLNESVSRELARQDASYANMVNVQYGQAGEITSVTTDMAKMNSLKAALLSGVQEELGEYAHMDFGVPLGTLLGSSLMHGRGPEIPVRVTLSGNITAEFDSQFTSAGINQTKHTICLHVQTTLYTFLPGASATAVVETDLPVAETIIVGEVPWVVAGTQGK
ncbi:MAG TPA: sporulation protein YunB [Candidatus Caccousia avistercoris]|nr:sporulation protein YunB [Candidatus Caccousia avistercoris]